MFRRVDPRQPFRRKRAHGRVLAHVDRRANRAFTVKEEREWKWKVPWAETEQRIFEYTRRYRAKESFIFHNKPNSINLQLYVAD